MSTPPFILRIVEVFGTAAMWLLEGRSPGRLMCVQRNPAAVRSARHVWGDGRLIVRKPAPAATATHHGKEIRTVAATGCTVTVAGPAEVITEPADAVHCRRTPSGWRHGRHNTLPPQHPKTVTGIRPTRAEA
ncbi:pyridoxamine 5'-phosphate oxidase family protein [Streptomyces sp. NPDC046984]|uniref:pyridoxamine 5'-phosphate oxidase family protein n=1 Tax=Streptomyces sp. NPDC046984 TaxID=3155138 RepID=UPI0033E7E537